MYYFVPSLNTIVENDLQRWGYLDSITSLPHQPTTILPPPPPPSSSQHLPLSTTGSLSSNKNLPTSTISTTSSKSRANLAINTSIDPTAVKGSPAFIGSGVPPISPRRSDVVKCSNDNCSIYGELTRATGGHLNLFFGSFHLEDNVQRLKSVSLISFFISYFIFIAFLFSILNLIEF